jgi:hypothetical protein
VPKAWNHEERSRKGTNGKGDKARNNEDRLRGEGWIHGPYDDRP